VRTADKIALVWFVAFSAVTFIAFGFDKWKASRSGQRVSEFALMMLAAFGGWIGGFIGMIVFRHKTAKWTFKLKYALALIPFVAAVWVWWRYR
jgi:uncharacterized membrane protein YsdA (DUF1294 family)